MKFCSKCGKEIMDEAVICVHCGCPVTNATFNTAPAQPPVQPLNDPTESGGLATAAMIFAFLIPLLGFILGIVGACKYKTPSYKGTSSAAIFVSIVVWIVSFAILMSL